jgi:hypothetical protein
MPACIFGRPLLFLYCIAFTVLSVAPPSFSSVVAIGVVARDPRVVARRAAAEGVATFLRLSDAMAAASYNFWQYVRANRISLSKLRRSTLLSELLITCRFDLAIPAKVPTIIFDILFECSVAIELAKIEEQAFLKGSRICFSRRKTLNRIGATIDQRAFSISGILKIESNERHTML